MFLCHWFFWPLNYLMHLNTICIIWIKNFERIQIPGICPDNPETVRISKKLHKSVEVALQPDVGVDVAAVAGRLSRQDPVETAIKCNHLLQC